MRVLIADDDPIARLYLQDAVEDWGYAAIMAEDGTSACRILLQDDAPDLALLDWMMPEMHGIDICRTVRDANGLRYTYLVVLSSGDALKRSEIARDAGADDFLGKPVDPDALEKTLRAGTRIVRLENRLRGAAPCDRRAGMHGRDAMLGLLRTELHRSARTGKPVSILLYGVAPATVGAQGKAGPPDVISPALKETGMRIRRILRPYDMLGRVADDRVLVVLPDCDAPDAGDVAARAGVSISSDAARFSVSIAAVTATKSADSSPRIAWTHCIPSDPDLLCELEGLLRHTENDSGGDIP